MRHDYRKADRAADEKAEKASSDCVRKRARRQQAAGRAGDSADDAIATNDTGPASLRCILVKIHVKTSVGHHMEGQHKWRLSP